MNNNYREAFTAAFTAALRDGGVELLKKTSLFGSNDKAISRYIEKEREAA